MGRSVSIYYVEVLEENVAKKVPHTKGTKHTDFISRADAKSFLATLIANNCLDKFRLCKEVTTHIHYPWQNKNQ